MIKKHPTRKDHFWTMRRISTIAMSLTLIRSFKPERKIQWLLKRGDIAKTSRCTCCERIWPCGEARRKKTCRANGSRSAGNLSSLNSKTTKLRNAWKSADVRTFLRVAHRVKIWSKILAKRRLFLNYKNSRPMPKISPFRSSEETGEAWQLQARQSRYLASPC